MKETFDGLKQGDGIGRVGGDEPVDLAVQRVEEDAQGVVRQRVDGLARRHVLGADVGVDGVVARRPPQRPLDVVAPQQAEAHVAFQFHALVDVLVVGQSRARRQVLGPGPHLDANTTTRSPTTNHTKHWPSKNKVDHHVQRPTWAQLVNLTQLS